MVQNFFANNPEKDEIFSQIKEFLVPTYHLLKDQLMIHLRYFEKWLAIFNDKTAVDIYVIVLKNFFYDAIYKTFADFFYNM